MVVCVLVSGGAADLRRVIGFRQRMFRSDVVLSRELAVDSSAGAISDLNSKGASGPGQSHPALLHWPHFGRFSSHCIACHSNNAMNVASNSKYLDFPLLAHVTSQSSSSGHAFGYKR